MMTIWKNPSSIVACAFVFLTFLIANEISLAETSDEHLTRLKQSFQTLPQQITVGEGAESQVRVSADQLSRNADTATSLLGGRADTTGKTHNGVTPYQTNVSKASYKSYDRELVSRHTSVFKYKRGVLSLACAGPVRLYQDSKGWWRGYISTPVGYDAHKNGIYQYRFSTHNESFSLHCYSHWEGILDMR